MSLKKGLHILNKFSLTQSEWTVEELSNSLEMPSSSMYRYIRTLKEEGYLKERDGKYSLGFQVIHLAQIARQDFELFTVAKEIMDALSKKYNETFLLSVKSGNHVVCIAKAESLKNSIKVSSEEGAIMPLYAGGSSKALLAYQDEDFINEFLKENKLKKYTENTLVDIEQLKLNLESVRKKGYAISDSEQDENISALGFPIFSSRGDIVASLSLVVPNFRKSIINNEVLQSEMKQATLDIGKFL